MNKKKRGTMDASLRLCSMVTTKIVVRLWVEKFRPQPTTAGFGSTTEVASVF
jgi:hypothetical protein